MRLATTLSVLVLCLAIIASPEMTLALDGLNKIPPQRLLLIFPVIVLVIIAILLKVTRRRR